VITAVTRSSADRHRRRCGGQDGSHQQHSPDQHDLAAFRRRLLETLAAWRDNGGSAADAAGVLFCHPNTVRHRLRRIESATGRSLGDPKATAEILIALEAAMLGITR